ncbi:MAG: hypothetical protein EBX50_22060, partial [Chitinophagia bacterium]|nr:hypothetical protein [Chitinophagia bacterium]
MGATLCTLSAFCLRKVLWGNWTFEGDTSVWYVFFEYFSNSIFFGSLALWNPYMNGGEPFWPVWGLWRLIDPITVSWILAAKHIGISDLFFLHKAVFMTQCLAVIFGVSLLIRHITGRNFPAIMSAVYYCVYFFSHHAVDIHVMSIYIWPYILLFWLKWVEKPSLIKFLVFCYLIGLYLGSASYAAITGFTILLFAMPITFLFHGSNNQKPCAFKVANINAQSFRYFALGLILILLMSGPFFVSAFYLRDEVFPIARVAADRSAFENPIRSLLDYNYLSRTGTSSSLEGMLVSLAPYPSMGQYLEISSRILVLVTLLFSFLRALPFCLLLTICLALALGTNAPFHRLVTELFPPLFYVRNTFVFESFAAIFIAII